MKNNILLLSLSFVIILAILIKRTFTNSCNSKTTIQTKNTVLLTRNLLTTMIKNILISILLLFVSNISIAQKKTTQKKARPKPTVVKKHIESKYVKKRKIKYLYQDDFAIVVFFDNGKAAVTNEFILCQENLFYLYSIPTLYDYEIVKFDDIYISYSKKEDKNATGLRLSNDKWFIKDFEQIKELKKCKDNEIQPAEVGEKTEKKGGDKNNQ
jgi:hypothetical protein